MSKAHSRECNEFDCSAYLSHGLRWSANKCNQFDSYRSNNGIQNVGERYSQHTKQRENKSSVRDWGVLLQEQMNAATQKKEAVLIRKEANPIFRSGKNAEKLLEKQYYQSEYNTLMKWMDEEDIIVPPPSMFADKREEIQRISLVADEALGRMSYNFKSDGFNKQAPRYSCGNLANDVAVNAIETQGSPGGEVLRTNANNYDRHEESINYDIARDVAIRAIETPRGPPGMMSPGGFKNFVEEQLVGFGEESEKKNDADVRKRRLCRHFVKGFCLRADCCEFLHDTSIFCTDEQKVFLGGLPLQMTSANLKAKLEDQGLTVLNKPRIMRGYTPQVCLGSVRQAEKLIARRFIYIDDNRVDVRPYQDREQLRQGLPNIVKRSVFLGGLPDSTTGDMIVDDLQRLDVKVVNFPVVKNGYAPRVVLGSLEHAKMLVALKRVMVNGAPVDVRPYVNFRKRY